MKIILAVLAALALTACGPIGGGSTGPLAEEGKVVHRSESTSTMCELFSDDEVKSLVGEAVKQPNNDYDFDLGGCFAQNTMRTMNWGIADGSHDDLLASNLPVVGVTSDCSGVNSVQANDVQVRIVCELPEGGTFVLINGANVYDEAGLGESDTDATVEMFRRGIARLQP